MADAPRDSPKLFVSYSWTTPDHEAWVIRLAEELVSQGIHVLIDKWDLQPGHDAYAFMESMVTDNDVKKVILICDKKYMEKANARIGGAGAEAQILTPQLYAQKSQDKYVAVIVERDPTSGDAHTPAFYGGRIYIDLSEPSIYNVEFDRLVRWVYDKPLHSRPPLGDKPSFLKPATDSANLDLLIPHRRAIDAVRNSTPNSISLVGEYLSTFASELEKLRIALSKDVVLDDLTINAIDTYTPYRNGAIQLFLTCAQHQRDTEATREFHRFFEQILPYTARPDGVNSWHEEEFDHYRFILHELFLFLIAVMLKFERFSFAEYLFENEYFWDNPNNHVDQMHSYKIFRQPIRALSIRNDRLSLHRTSLRADLLYERNNGTGIDFKYLMAADFIAFLRARRSDSYPSWWPETLLYAPHHYAKPFEIFARAKSAKYFSRIKGMIGVSDAEEFRNLVLSIQLDERNIPKWQFDRLDVKRLSAVDTVATLP